MSIASTIIEWELLFQVVWAALAAGVGVTVAVSFGILGAARFSESRRNGQRIAMVAYAFITTLGFGLCLAAVALGVFVLRSG